MKPIEVERALERCDRVSAWRRDETLRRWRWAVSSYIDGWVTQDRLTEERELFVAEAEKLITTQALYDFLNREPRPITEADIQRRTQWLEREALRATRTELQRQRKKLREGHQTLTAIRRLLARGVRSSLPAESRPAKTSPTL